MGPFVTGPQAQTATERGQQVAPLQLAYLAIVSPEAGLYQGGVLVVDEVGLPVEFRYSDPVRPSKLQQVLYGKTLGNYIKRHVVLDTLINSLTQPYALILTQEECFLEAVLPTPVVRLVGTQTTALGKVAGESKVLSPADWLVQLTAEGGSPVRVSVAAGSGAEPLTAVQPIVDTLLQAAQTLDVIEPFERVSAALQTLVSTTTP